MISSNTTAIRNLNSFSISKANARICGCAAFDVLSLKKCLNSLRFAVITSSVLQPGATQHRAFEIFGANGNAVVRPIEPPVLQIDLAQPAGPYQARMQTVELPPFRRYVGEFAELAEAIRAKRPLAVTPQEDLLVHEMLLRASGML